MHHTFMLKKSWKYKYFEHATFTFNILNYESHLNGAILRVVCGVDLGAVAIDLEGDLVAGIGPGAELEVALLRSPEVGQVDLVAVGIELGLGHVEDVARGVDEGVRGAAEALLRVHV